MKILIFGGKFNPIHIGHKAIIKEVEKQLTFDEIWLMPNGIEENSRFIGDKYRLKIIENFCNKNNYKLVDIEALQEQYINTIDTAQHLTNIYDYEFYFLIGTDQLKNFKKWPDYKKLSNLFKFISVSRKGFKNQNDTKINIQHIKVDAPDVSSTQFRKGDLSVVDKEDLIVLASDILFWKNYLKSTLSEKRYVHSLNVASKAKELAEKFLPNKIKDAHLAALIHDITKEWSPEKHKQYIDEKIINSELPDTWHQWSGSKYVEELGITNKQILLGIKNHTTTAMEMNDFDKLIYCADKTSDERDYDELPAIKKACQISLDDCFKSCFNAKMQYLKKHDIKITPRTQKLINRWK